MQKLLLKYSYFFLLYPFFLLTIVVTSNTGNSFAPERVIFLYLLFYFIAFFISSKKSKSIYTQFIYLCSVLITFLEIGYVSIYKERITPSTAFILLETNSAEVKEYLSEYFDMKIITWLLLLIIPSYFILKSVNTLIHQFTMKQVLVEIKSDFKKIFNHKIVSAISNWWTKTCENTLKKTLLGVSILMIGGGLFMKDNHHKYFSLYQLYEGYISYSDEVVKYKAFLTADIDNELFSSIKRTNSSSVKETYVLIIGESTTRNHLGIYNYYRNTTPYLNKLKDELVVFDNVISPHSHTIPTLEKVLTFGNKENPQAKFNGSVIQLMKSAGYKTFWVSNQVPVGVNETMVAMMAKASDYTHFTNLGGAKELRSLDERVLPYFEQVLKDTSTKKFIVVHLLGTHTHYDNRYPKEYNQFFDVPKTKFPSEKAYSTINEYDNSILYNDYIISELISGLKKQANTNEKLFAIYISDHGEDVFETVDFTGHSEVIGSQPMFQIPFVFWSNNEKMVEKYKGYYNRKYMTDDLIYSIADLSGLSFVGMDSSRSIFNDRFIKRPRIIRGDMDYDKLYKTK